jgi:hypothetical protein
VMTLRDSSRSSIDPLAFHRFRLPKAANSASCSSVGWTSAKRPRITIVDRSFLMSPWQRPVRAFPPPMEAQDASTQSPLAFRTWRFHR